MSAHSHCLGIVEQLDRLGTDMTEKEIVQRGVDIAQLATQSRIAYLHFLNEDQNTIELCAWSRDTLAGCNAVSARHYPLPAAGIWADSARTRQPCIHNDYEMQVGRRGLPPGHSRLIRHLGLPVLEEGKVRLVIGVGNKDAHYGRDDVEMLHMVARRIWSLTRQRRVLERYLDLERRFRSIQEIALVSGLEYDVDEDGLRFDNNFGSIFQVRHATEIPSSLHEFLAFVAPADHDGVRQAFCNPSRQRLTLHLSCHRQSGDHFPAELRLDFRAREIGRGYICIGILQDISVQAEVEDLRRRADHDPLTGLPNRNRLKSIFLQGLERRRPGGRIAFHYLDLDGFKPVNDSYGHPTGDEVLRIVAQRLRQTVRQDDLVVRMGGDEFAVVQTGIHEPSAATVLSEKIIKAVSAPISALGHHIEVGVSSGIALCTSHDHRLTEVSAAADRALYQAKAAGGRCCVIADGDAGKSMG